MGTKHTIEERGQAMIIAVLFLVGGSVIMLTGVAAPVLTDIRTVSEFSASRQSYSLAEGGVEDVAYRLMEGLPVSSTETLVEGTTEAETTNATVLGMREVVAVGDERSAIRRTKLVLEEGSGASFFYGLQSDTGGIHLKNSATIRGNVYSNGPVSGENSNIVRGSVVSAGAAGLIDGVHATGTAYAHTIDDSDIDGDAYYQVIDDTDVGGTEYPGSTDLATSTMPIPDSLIEEWKSAAAAGGTYAGTCPYKISSSTTTGPLKIPCNVEITGTPTITLNGNVWVLGNIDIQNSATMNVGSSLSGKTVAIVADNPSNQTGSGKITLKNSAVFNGAGENSYILFVSQNRSAQMGGAVTAIDVQNSVQGDLLVYAAHGKIILKNSIDLKEVAAYRIEVENSAEVIYESGLTNLLFTTGPAGGYTIESWREI